MSIEEFSKDYQTFLTISSWAILRNVSVDSVEHMIKAASQLYPNRSEWLSIRGLALLVRGQFKEAASNLQCSLQIDEDMLDVQVLLLFVNVISWAYNRAQKKALRMDGEILHEKLQAFLDVPDITARNMAALAVRYYDNSIANYP